MNDSSLCKFLNTELPLLYIGARKLSHHVFHELAIHLKLLDHTSHVLRRWWEVATTTTNSWSNHPVNI